MFSESVVYRAADYLRLSKEDGDCSTVSGKAESNSISSQRELILDYVRRCPDIELVSEFVDDGYTGTNFERPNFQRMMEAVACGEINCIIVKDLSRFGREYIDAGKYIEKIFPQKGVRFISVNDGYDSLTSTQASDNLIIPFKNLINDSYSRDISIKIRTNLEAKRRHGEFIANYPVYGYVRDPEDRNHLVVDPDAAQVVRDIYSWKIDGLSPETIAAKLNADGVLCPFAYKKAHGSRYSTAFQTSPAAKWSGVAVTRILTNEVYCGVLVQGKRTTANYKIKKVITKQQQDWVRTEDAHEPIVNRNQFFVVQRLMGEDNRRTQGLERVRPLSGRVYCGDCGCMAKRRVISKGGRKYVYYMCPSTRKGGKSGCSKRSISENQLEEAVLNTLKVQIGVVLDMDQAMSDLDALTWEKRELSKLNASMEGQEEQLRHASELRLSAYEDFREGLLDREEFTRIREELTLRIKNAQSSIDSLRTQYAQLSEGEGTRHGWLADFRAYKNISELTRPVVVTLIDRVLLFPEKKIQIELRLRNQIDHAAEFLDQISPKNGMSSREVS